LFERAPFSNSLQVFPDGLLVRMSYLQDSGTLVRG
jgi:hypothetical protein